MREDLGKKYSVGGMDAGNPEFGVADIDGSLDFRSRLERVEVALVADGKFHGHGTHPIADLMVADDRRADLGIDANHLTANFASTDRLFRNTGARGEK